MSHERESFGEMSQDKLRAQARVMRVMRFVAPLMALLIGAGVMIAFPEHQNIIGAVTLFFAVSELLIFSWVYKKSVETLRERFGERLP